MKLLLSRKKQNKDKTDKSSTKLDQNSENSNYSYKNMQHILLWIVIYFSKDYNYKNFHLILKCKKKIKRHRYTATMLWIFDERGGEEHEE